MSDNIYLTKEEGFGFDKTKTKLPFVLSNDLIDGWVKKYKLKNNETKDFTVEIEKQRYRVHLFNSFRGWNAALRRLPIEIMSFNELGMDNDSLNEILSICKGTGLTLFCGPTGAGKSTTMNTVIDSLYNSNDLGITITIEDPIEYLHNKDIIFQREVGRTDEDKSHVKSFEQGLIEAVRANPTTIVIGEIRDSATALEVVRAGLNGHRVFATLHASNVKEAISRLWGFLDDQGDELLVQSLQGIMAQHLIHISDTKKHCLFETLEVDKKTKSILNQILDHNSQVTLNTELRQEGRLTLVEKKMLLERDGIDKDLLNAIKT